MLLHKVCRKCKRSLSLDQFGRDKKAKDGLNYWCKACCRASDRRTNTAERIDQLETWKLANPDRVAITSRRSRLKNRYGLSLEDYDERVKDQQGTCAICQLPPRGSGHVNAKLHVDHDHVTGEVRSLLCRACNIGIASFEDDPARIRAAAQYVETHAERIAP